MGRAILTFPYWVFFLIAPAVVYFGDDLYRQAAQRDRDRAALLMQPPPAPIDLSALDPAADIGPSREVNVIAAVRAGTVPPVTLDLGGTRFGARQPVLLYGAGEDPETAPVRAAMLLTPGDAAFFEAYPDRFLRDPSDLREIYKFGGMVTEAPLYGSRARKALAEAGLHPAETFFFLNPFLFGREGALAPAYDPGAIRYGLWALAGLSLIAGLVRMRRRKAAASEQDGETDVDGADDGSDLEAGVAGSVGDGQTDAAGIVEGKTIAAAAGRPSAAARSAPFDEDSPIGRVLNRERSIFEAEPALDETRTSATGSDPAPSVRGGAVYRRAAILALASLALCGSLLVLRPDAGAVSGFLQPGGTEYREAADLDAADLDMAVLAGAKPPGVTPRPRPPSTVPPAPRPDAASGLASAQADPLDMPAPLMTTAAAPDAKPPPSPMQPGTLLLTISIALMAVGCAGLLVARLFHLARACGVSLPGGGARLRGRPDPFDRLAAEARTR